MIRFQMRMFALLVCGIVERRMGWCIRICKYAIKGLEIQPQRIGGWLDVFRICLRKETMVLYFRLIEKSENELNPNLLPGEKEPA